MTDIHHTAARAAGEPDELGAGPPTVRRRRALWPLLISLSGVLALVALFSDARADANSDDFDYPVTAQDVMALGHESFRLSGALGYLLVLLLLVTAVVWKHRVERRFPGSRGATLVGYGVLATSGLVALTYGWRGALGNYLPTGIEGDAYDADGLYSYYIMNDFSPYIAFVPLLASAYGLAWMAFGDRIVSRGLGGCAALFATALLATNLVTGVPGLPAMIVAGMVLTGIWLTVGRSTITQAGDPQG